MKIKDLVDILGQYNEKSEVTVSTSECGALPFRCSL